jgi:hypothetical protein
MTPDTASKTSFKPASRRSPHPRTAKTGPPATGPETAHRRAAAQGTQVAGTPTLARKQPPICAARGPRWLRRDVIQIWLFCARTAAVGFGAPQAYQPGRAPAGRGSERLAGHGWRPRRDRDARPCRGIRDYQPAWLPVRRRVPPVAGRAEDAPRVVAVPVVTAVGAEETYRPVPSCPRRRRIAAARTSGPGR